MRCSRVVWVDGLEDIGVGRVGGMYRGRWGVGRIGNTGLLRELVFPTQSESALVALLGLECGVDGYLIYDNYIGKCTAWFFERKVRSVGVYCLLYGARQLYLDMSKLDFRDYTTRVNASNGFKLLGLNWVPTQASVAREILSFFACREAPRDWYVGLTLGYVPVGTVYMTGRDGKRNEQLTGRRCVYLP